METLLKIIFGVCLGVPLAIIIIVPAMLFKAFVLMQLWAWFIVGHFGVPALSIPVAIGITLTVQILKGFEIEKKTSCDREDSSPIASFVTVNFVMPALMLGIGYLVTRWM